MAERRPQVRGSTAQDAVVSEYGLEVDNAEWYDAVDPNTGTKYEVKSGLDDVRLWEDQHRSLVASDRAGTAWYAFVKVDSAGVVRAIQRRKPATVTRLVNEAGGWVKSGHHRTEKREKKLPVGRVI
jgi:hypothetical protein